MGLQRNGKPRTPGPAPPRPRPSIIPGSFQIIVVGK
jgi:hypothetical protein